MAGKLGDRSILQASELLYSSFFNLFSKGWAHGLALPTACDCPMTDSTL